MAIATSTGNNTTNAVADTATSTNLPIKSSDWKFALCTAVARCNARSEVKFLEK